MKNQRFDEKDLMLVVINMRILNLYQMILTLRSQIPFGCNAFTGAAACPRALSTLMSACPRLASAAQNTSLCQ